MKITALMGLIALLAILAFIGNTSGDDNYVGSDACGASGCHKANFDTWEDTLHGIDFSDWDYHGTPTNKYTMAGGNDTTGAFGSCASCHVVGWDDTDNGGTISTEPWNSTHNLPLGSIGCENCHGPGKGHVDDRSGTPEYMQMGEFAYSLSCAGWSTTGIAQEERMGSCHDGGRMGGIEDEDIPGYYMSGHAGGIGPSSPKGNPSCYHCMAADGFISVTIEGNDAPDEITHDEATDTYWVDGKMVVYGIYCAACHDPHEHPDDTHYQLRAPEEEICELCHYNTHAFPDTHVRHPTTEFRDGINGKDVPVTTYMEEVTCPECHMWQSPRGTEPEDFHISHSWEPTGEACVECHSMYTAETAWEWVVETEEHIETLATAVDPLWTSAKAAREWADGNGTLTEDVNMTYLKAEWNIEYVHQEGSGGVHNPPYAEALIAKATEQFKEVIAALDIGEVTGDVKWDDGTAIGSADIKDGSGATMATTDAAGNYSFYAPSGDMVFTVWSGTDLLGTIDTTVAMHGVTNAGTTTIKKAEEVKPPDDDDDDGDVGDWGLNNLAYILIIIIIILIIVAAMMMRK